MLIQPSDLQPQIFSCLASQTVPISLMVLLTEKVEASTWPARVAKILNNGLKHVKLDDFDYILRVDSDAWLPPNFIEGNLKDKPDVCGLGLAMLIKTVSFQKVMHSKFDQYSDDTAIHFEFQRHGLKAVYYKVDPAMLRKPGATHSLMYWVEQGIAYYQLGVEPLHMLAKTRLGWRHILSVYGYIYAAFKHVPQCRCADYVRTCQLQRLLHPWRERLTLCSARFPKSW